MKNDAKYPEFSNFVFPDFEGNKLIASWEKCQRDCVSDDPNDIFSIFFTQSVKLIQDQFQLAVKIVKEKIGSDEESTTIVPIICEQLVKNITTIQSNTNIAMLKIINNDIWKKITYHNFQKIPGKFRISKEEKKIIGIINNFIKKNENIMKKTTNCWEKEKKKNLTKIADLLTAYLKLTDAEQAQFTEINDFILSYKEQFNIPKISQEITNQFKFYQTKLAGPNYESSSVYEEDSPIDLSFSGFNPDEESIR
ncbi:hypothetical protein [Spiroplasma eriocheiris]|uniref:Uncharacterized protein n=1 Tax=Spiroplasma eriocheiris TaxID=315358 RepID=A0A0H3XKJ3_9MOLU|nr:hypothetical protein [Spiroplasma eriocheiris]AHF57999.1 hypothetical protein SPE_0879 [Spiroplasma eriocheiris CCTCC M 207170]AKM54441.1 hypothetical protein SERIO_v1c08810 [Spiroplasma eriocheiris]